MEIAVVLINYNLAKYTIECIRSILASDVHAISIVLVDNGSLETDVEELEAALPGIPVIRIPENIQCAGGLNVGIQHALETPATRVFILNNDTIVETSAIRLLRASSWDVAVPKILYAEDPNIVWSAGARWRVFPPMVLIRGNRKHDSPEYDSPCQLDYATGCAFMIKREVFEKIGLFDEDFGCYQEDWDFFYRVKAGGYHTGYVPQARILHRVSLTLGKYPANRRYNLARNMVHFYLKENRFQHWQLYSYIVWVLLREFIKGNLFHLPDYWHGFREGLKIWARRPS